MTTITVEPDLKQALERRAAEAGVPLAELLRRAVASPAAPAGPVEPAELPEPRHRTPGEAAAYVLSRIPVPPADPATSRTDDEVTAEFEREVAAALDDKARRAGLKS